MLNHLNSMQTLSPQDNHHVPAEAPALDAFNLGIGAAFMVTSEPDPRVWVVVRICRDSTFERVYIWARNANMYELGTQWGDLSIPTKAFDFDFNHKVALVGLVVNADDPDDNNFGTA